MTLCLSAMHLTTVGERDRPADRRGEDSACVVDEVRVTLAFLSSRLDYFSFRNGFSKTLEKFLLHLTETWIIEKTEAGRWGGSYGKRLMWVNSLTSPYLRAKSSRNTYYFSHVAFFTSVRKIYGRYCPFVPPVYTLNRFPKSDVFEFIFSPVLPGTKNLYFQPVLLEVICRLGLKH